MVISPGFILSLGCSMLAPQDETAPRTLEVLIERMEELSARSGIDQLGWRVFARLGGRHYTQELGLEVLGRFHRGEGIRTMVTTLSCADAQGHLKQPGPNHYVTIHARDAVAIAPITLLIEAPDPRTAFPYLIARVTIQPGRTIMQ